MYTRSLLKTKKSIKVSIFSFLFLQTWSQVIEKYAKKIIFINNQFNICMKLFVWYSRICHQYKEKVWTPWSAFDANRKLVIKVATFSFWVYFPAQLNILGSLQERRAPIPRNPSRPLNSTQLNKMYQTNIKTIFKDAISIDCFIYFDLSYCYR